MPRVSTSRFGIVRLNFDSLELITSEQLGSRL
jgi:hypothetical protein